MGQISICILFPFLISDFPGFVLVCLFFFQECNRIVKIFSARIIVILCPPSYFGPVAFTFPCFCNTFLSAKYFSLSQFFIAISVERVGSLFFSC